MPNNLSPSLASLLASEGVSILSVSSNNRINQIQERKKERPLLSIIKSMGGSLKATGAATLSVVGIAAVMATTPNISHAQMMEFNNNTKDTRPLVSVKSHKTQTFSNSERSNESHFDQSFQPKNFSSARMDIPASISSAKELEAFFLDPDAGNNLFAALATRMENLVTTIYEDPAGGRNIGIGYNIDAIGTEQAWKDLANIGMKKEYINILKNNDSAQYYKIKITPQQAGNLLLLVQPRYESIAAKWLGGNQWEKILVNHQSSTTYLAYQTGGRIEKFQKTRSLIISGNNEEAQKHLVTYYQSVKDAPGKMTENTRFKKIVGLMWLGPQIYSRNFGLHKIADKWDLINSNSPGEKTKVTASLIIPAANTTENTDVISFDNRPSKQNRQQQTRATPITRQTQAEISDNDADDIELQNIKSEISVLDAIIAQRQKNPQNQFNFNHEMQRSNIPTAPPLKQIIYR